MKKNCASSWLFTKSKPKCLWEFPVFCLNYEFKFWFPLWKAQVSGSWTICNLPLFLHCYCHVKMVECVQCPVLRPILGHCIASRGLTFSYEVNWYNVFKTSVINLVFASPCIIILSSESNNQMQQLLKFITCRLNTAQHVSGIFLDNVEKYCTNGQATDDNTKCAHAHCMLDT